MTIRKRNDAVSISSSKKEIAALAIFMRNFRFLREIEAII